MSTVFVSFWKRDNCLPDFKGTERFTIGNFTIPIVKRSFLKRIFIFFLGEKKEHFTIGKKEKESYYRYSKMTYSKTHL
jgi:hypothetical protein